MLLGVQSLASQLVPIAIAFWLALGTLALTVASAAWLAHARCPRCGEIFIGNTVPDGGGPEVEMFTKSCRYCGHAG